MSKDSAKTSDTVTETGSIISVRILGVDVEQELFIVSHIRNITEYSTRKYQLSSLELEKAVEIRIELIRSNFLVGSMNQGRNLVTVMTSDYHNPQARTGNFTLGDILIGRIVYSPCPTQSPESRNHPYSHLPIYSIADVHEKLDKSSISNTNKDVEEFFMKCGMVKDWIIDQITPTEITLRPVYHSSSSRSVKGIMHISNAITFDSYSDDLEDSLEESERLNLHSQTMAIHSKHPFYGLVKGNVISCRIVHIQNHHNSSNDSTSITMYVALERHHHAIQTNMNDKFLFQSTIKPNCVYLGVIIEIHSLYCLVALGPFAKCQLFNIDVSSQVDSVQKFVNNCFVGQKIVVGVSSISSSNKKVIVSRSRIEKYLTNRSDKPGDIVLAPLPNLCPGSVVYGMLDLQGSSRTPQPPAISVFLGESRLPGRVCVCEFCDIDDWSDLSYFPWKTKDIQPGSQSPTQLENIHHADIVRCKVLSIDDNCIQLSLRSSRLVCKFKI
jgi:exosome complex RNA-binding protein Csl4